MITKEELKNEQENLLRTLESNDDEFVGMLDTMANFHRYSLPEQLSLHIHAPAGTPAVATRKIWERAFGTSIVENAERIPLLSADGDVSYVYDIRDTNGFLTGNARLHSIPWSYQPEDESSLRETVHAEENISTDDALRAYIQSAVVDADMAYPSQTAVAVEYVVRKRLNLSADDTSLLAMSRVHVDMGEMLADVQQLSKSLLDAFAERKKEEEKEHENSRRAETYALRDVGQPEAGLSGQGASAGMGEDGRIRGRGAVSEGLSGSDVGEVGEDRGEVAEGNGSDGRTQETRFDGLGGAREQYPVDGVRDHEEGNRGVEDLPNLGGLSSDEAEKSFRGFIDSISSTLADGHVSMEQARQYYRDGLTLIVSGEGDFTAEKRDELVAFVAQSLSHTYKKANAEETVEKAEEDESKDVAEATTSFDMSSSIRDWYQATYPKDELADRILGVSFQQLMDALEHHEDYYHLIGVGDSLVRERIFTGLSNFSNRPYNEIYDLWLDPAHVQTVQEDKIATTSQDEYKYYLIRRPSAPGAQPEGSLRVASDEEIAAEQSTLPDDVKIQGIAYYDHPLTEKEINDFELLDAAVIASRTESVRAYVSTQGEDAPWLTKADGSDFSFAELYAALNGEIDYPSFLDFVGKQIPEETYGAVIENDFVSFGEELAHRMNVPVREIHQLMAKNYVKQVASAMKFFRENLGEASAQAQDEQPFAEPSATNTDSANEAVQASSVTGETLEDVAVPTASAQSEPLQAESVEVASTEDQLTELQERYAPVVEKLRNIFSAEIPLGSLSEMFDYGLSLNESVAIGFLYQKEPDLRGRINDFLEDINFHHENALLMMEDYAEYFKQFLPQNNQTTADVELARLVKIETDIRNRLQMRETWKNHLPFDSKPYAAVKERVLSLATSGEDPDYDSLPQNNMIAIAVGLAYLEHPELFSPLAGVLSHWEDYKLYKYLRNGEFKKYFQNCGLEIRNHIETATETAEKEASQVEDSSDMQASDETAASSDVSDKKDDIAGETAGMAESQEDTSRTEEASGTQDSSEIAASPDAADEKQDLSVEDSRPDAGETAPAASIDEVTETNGVIAPDVTESQAIDLSTLDMEATLDSVTGKRAVFRRNLAAIQIVHQLESAHRAPTEEERKVLLAYSGFGAISEAFDATNYRWRNEYALAKEILSDTEFASARESTLTAFYTPHEIIKGIYDGLKEAGFAGNSNILDPSTGTGRFLREMPEEMKHGSSLVGVELDELTSKVAQALNQDAAIVHSPFEDTHYKDNSFDLAISNVPFGNFPINDTRYAGHNYLIHDYFINRMIDQVRPGGIVVAITSKGTMDKKDDTARKEFARKAELVKAIRLPFMVFEEAGTDVTSDILIFRKRSKELAPEDPLPEWVNSTEYTFHTYPKDLKYLENNYFVEHRSDILGNRRIKNSAIGYVVDYFAADYHETVASIGNKIADSIKELGKFYQPSEQRLPKPEQEKTVQKDNEYGFLIDNGKLMYLSPAGELGDADVSESLEPKIRSAVKIRDLFRKMIDEEVHDCTDERLGALQAELNKLYDEHVKKFGHFNEDRSFVKAFAEDSSHALLLSMEEFEDKKFIGKADMFTKRTVHAYHVPTHVDTANDALLVSMQEKGKVNLSYMAKLMDSTPADLVKELEFREIFEDIEHGKYVTADEYLSGDVRARIEYLQKRMQFWLSGRRSLINEQILTDALPVFDEPDFQDPLVARGMSKDDENGDISVSLHKYTDAEKRKFFQPEHRNILMFALKHAHYRDAYNFIKDMSEKYKEVADLLKDPMFGLGFMRNIPAYRRFSKDFPGFELVLKAKHTLEHTEYWSVETSKYANAYLAQVCRDYDHGARPEVFKREALLAGFKGFIEECHKKVDDIIAHPDNELIASLNEDIARAEKNLQALERVKPKDLSAEEINIFLGAPWIPTEDIAQFIEDKFRVPSTFVTVEYSPISGAWNVSASESFDNQEMTTVYGVDNDYNAMKLIQAALNHTVVNIHKTVRIDGEEKSVIDRDKTLLAARKIQDIREAFSKWIFKNEERKHRLVSYYNRHFNNIVPRHFDGSNLNFPDMNPEIKLRPHQKDAVARTLFGGNTLLAHVVGAGKTFEMQASAMEAKRIGLCSKSMMIMPKHLTQQFGAEFQRLYPHADILVAGEDDFTKENRQKFCAKIVAKNWDAVILSYEQFGKIPISYERRKKFLQDEADRILEAKAELASKNPRSFSVKQAQREYKKIMTSLAKLEADYHKHQDATITFEQLGIDRLYVDEAHYFKNLGFFTRISGMQSAHVQKTDDMIAKCDYLNEVTGERGIVFASGTPVSNSMAELYTLSRYLKPSRLKSQGLEAFDSWASTFGEEVTQMELEPAGDKFRQKTRFSHFANVPELISMFKEFADVKLGDQLKLPVPESDVHLVTAEASATQKAMIRDLVKRSEEIKKGNPRVINDESHQADSKKGIDNMLNITREGRYIALDPRSLNEELPDNPKSKVNLCADNVAKIYHDTADKKSTQLVFCDLATPSTDGSFNVYDALKEKLVQNGVKENEIAYIHSYNNPKKKEELFKKVRSGKVRVLLGSSDKLGVGTNIQDKLIAMHELDCPWKPAQIEQRRGRMVRVGNENPHVDIYRYVTKGTFDAYMWQTNEYKQKFISQVMTSKAPSRICDDVDDFQLEASKTKTACTENPIFQEQMTLENEIALLKMERAQFYQSKENLNHKIHDVYPVQLHALEKRKEILAADMERFSAQKNEPMTVDGKVYSSKEEIGKFLAKVTSDYYAEKVASSPRGTYHGLKFTVTYNPKEDIQPKLSFYGKGSYGPYKMTKTNWEANAVRFLEIGAHLQAAIEENKKSMEEKAGALEEAKAEYLVPFGKEELLASKERRLAEVNVLVLDSEKNESEAEKQSRLDALGDPEYRAVGDDCCKMYVEIAKKAYAIRDGSWGKEVDDAIAAKLVSRGYLKDNITEAIYKYSPSVPSREEAEHIVASHEPIAACR